MKFQRVGEVNFMKVSVLSPPPISMDYALRV